MLTRALGLAFILCLAASSWGAASRASVSPSFLAVVRDGQRAWLLSDDGTCLYLQVGLSPPECRLRLRATDGAPFRWPSRPTSFALWNGAWVFANGENLLWRFSAQGAFLDAVTAPDRITDLTASSSLLWLYTSLPSVQKSGERLWFSRDLRSFAASPVALVDDSREPAAKLVSGQLILAPGSAELLAVVHAIGPPTAVLLVPRGISRVVPLAYARTAARDALQKYRPGVSDLTAYSSPARDALLSADGALYVIRNREEVVVDGHLLPRRGLRVDHYDPAGALQGTATPAVTARFILRADADSVTTLSDQGVVSSARFSRPEKALVMR